MDNRIDPWTLLGLGIMACMIIIAIAGIITKQTPFALNTENSVQSGSQQAAQASGNNALPPPAKDVPLAMAGTGHCGGGTGSGGGCGCGAAK